MNTARLLARAGRSFARQPAVALGTTTVHTHATLAERVARMGTALRQRHGVEPGDPVALIMKNAPAYVEAMFAIWHAGGVAVPVNAKLHPREFAYILEHSGAKLCFVTPDLASAAEEAGQQAHALATIVDVSTRDYDRLAGADAEPLIERAGDDPAWLFYTSGTTGRPKGAMLSHRNLAVMAAGYFVDVDAIEATDSLLHAAPMSHGSGLYMVPHMAAGAQQLIPESGGFEPDEVFALLEHWRGISCFVAPTMVKRLTAAASDRDVRSENLKTIVYGGGPMYQADVHAALERFGNRFAQIYGQAETPMTITALAKRFHIDTDHPRFAERLASVGVPQALIDVRVTDDAGRPLPTDEIGEVQVRGDSVMLGYWRNAEATAETVVDGWLRTGDMGSFDEEGFLTLRDRSKDVIISGGTNIYPREVEEVLLAHPAVSEVAVIGEPDDEWGERVTAFVVAAPPAADGTAKTTDPEEELDAFCREHMARFKRPRRYRFVSSLPKNAYGKVLKTALREAGTSEA